jgi:lipopolysaccharide transport system ATP-binding protein
MIAAGVGRARDGVLEPQRAEGGLIVSLCAGPRSGLNDGAGWQAKAPAPLHCRRYHGSLIAFEGVSKSFRHGAGARLLRGHIQQWVRGLGSERFFALRDVSFRLEAGESMAVVGRNGAGKSTLLSLVAGLARPDRGRVTVDGRVAALLELGSGFHPDLTGVENLRLNASLLGLSRRRTEEVSGTIADFADIGDFLREPLRTYSTGMLMRLAFAIAIHVDPDVLIVDEVLAVGDQAFQAKCFERIRQFKAQGKTLLFVSHATQLVREICGRGLWLERGQVVMDGTSTEVLRAYTGLPGPEGAPPGDHPAPRVPPGPA